MFDPGLKEYLIKLGIDKGLLDLLAIFKDKKEIKELFEKFENAANSKEIVNETIKILIKVLNDKEPKYVTKDKLLLYIPLTRRTLEEMIRHRLIPFYQVSQKVRLFNLYEVLNFTKKFKVETVFKGISPKTVVELNENYKQVRCDKCLFINCKRR